MKRTYVWDDKRKTFVERVREVSSGHFVQPDLSDFKAGGKTISGRRQWREHLKQTNSVEFGYSDLKASTERTRSKQAAEAAAMKAAEKLNVKPAEIPAGEIREHERSRVSREVANRLHNRPAPPLEMLLKITLEEARRR